MHDRDKARELVEDGDFLEVFCAADLERLRGTRPQRPYTPRHAPGQIKEFTGISSPYEAPETPELSVDTGKRI